MVADERKLVGRGSDMARRLRGEEETMRWADVVGWLVEHMREGLENELMAGAFSEGQVQLLEGGNRREQKWIERGMQLL